MNNMIKPEARHKVNKARQDLRQLLRQVSESPAGMLVKEATSITGGISKPGKMPGASHNIPARDCNVGSRLRTVKGSVCHGCYALKGRYVFPTVQAALYRRLDALDHPLWIDAMVVLVGRQRVPFFRWFDSGDLQSIDHLARIVSVCEQTPHINHWLPTREYKIVSDYRASRLEPLPSNLTIRLSAHMVDGQPPTAYGLPTSTVTTDRAKRTCPAPDQDNQCGKCRACWNPTVQNVAYGKH